jgi:copper chaperone CopZ
MKYLAVILCLLVLSAPALAAEKACPAPQVVAKVNGMVCDFCAQSVKKVLEKESSVQSVDIDLTAKEVRIALKPGQTLSDDVIKSGISYAGYDLVGIEHSCAQGTKG